MSALTHLDTVHVCPQTAMYTHLVEDNIKIFQCYLEQDSLPTMLSTGWFQEKIQVWFTIYEHNFLFHNQMEID